MHTFGSFNVVDNTVFNQRIDDAIDSQNDVKHNYCPDCKTPMDLSSGEYHCKMCGLTQKNEIYANPDHQDAVGGNMRIGVGTNKGKFYNTMVDYTKTQHRAILTQLQKQHKKYKGRTFPLNVLRATADQYNNIQKMVTSDEFDDEGNVCGKKKFVRRGGIKDEVLAALLYFECKREKIIRKNRDIADFMELATDGFARGEDIVRDLAADGHIELPPDNDDIIGYAEKYIEVLGIDELHLSFIAELVEVSEERKICMTSQLSSKVVGALWILITKLALGITAQQLEKAADNTKKNTFIKFFNGVFDNYPIFEHVFTKYNIPK